MSSLHRFDISHQKTEKIPKINKFFFFQKSVPAYDTDTEDTLGARILKWEHKIFPKAIELFCDGRLHVDGRIVRIDGEVILD